MKKLNILLFIIFSVITQTDAIAKDNKITAVNESQKFKVKVITLNGGNFHSESKLERVLTEELNDGWIYDYNIDISTDISITKLLVFKRLPVTK